MRTVGRLLRLLRMAAGLSLDDAAIDAELTPARIRELEAGVGVLGYLEGATLAKAYLLCPSCLMKHLRAAAARGEVAHEFAVPQETDDDD